MECPHCNYIHGKNVINDKDDFYKLSNDIKVIRENKWQYDEMSVYACPNCRKLFIDE
jgi:hypothetical protein